MKPSLQLSARILLALFAAALAALALPSSAQEFQEGKQYIRLKNPQPVESGNKIEVLEFFSYGCPHCADLEPILENWLKTLPPDVQFRRVPVLFQPRWNCTSGGSVFSQFSKIGSRTG